jgi:hypothetical protein
MSVRRLVRFLVVGAAFSAVCLAAGAADAAAEKENPLMPGRLTSIDPELCEPFQVRTAVMAVHREKGTLVVAEREIRTLDAMINGKHLITEFLGQDGKPEEVGTFRTGQYVKVEGFLHPDGYVAALVVQKIAKPQAAKFIYRPVAESAKRSGQSKQQRSGKISGAR